MFVALCLVLLYVQIITTSVTCVYTVPTPEFEVIKPRGFRVSVPHHEGIDLFAFHGNVNQPMEHRAAGQISTEVTRNRGNRWIINIRDVRLRNGDKIYYWVYVRKEGLGYLAENLEYEVTDSATTPAEEYPNPPRTEVPSVDSSHTDECIYFDNRRCECPLPPTPSSADTNYRASTCEGTLVNLTQTLIALHEETDVLKAIIEKDPRASRRLMLEGRISLDEDATNTAQAIVQDFLELPSIRVTGAIRYENKSILFEVPNLRDKVAIIKGSRRLEASGMRLVY